jgi:2'-hydroxyisoflavone reductase
MRLLVLGGTRFLGRAVVDAALACGAEVTTFTRGLSGRPPDGVEALHGDRTAPEDLAVLGGREWDVVVDTSGYVPRVVGESARLLADRAGHYVFVSTLNVYSGWGNEVIHDTSPVHDCPPDAGPDDGDYGYLKAGCERAVEQHFPGRCLQARAGLIVGPYDDVGRLPWWVGRIARGGDVLAPGRPDQPMSLVDARDLAAWLVHCGRTGVGGAFAATGPMGLTTFAGLLDVCRDVTGSDARPVWVPDDQLLEHGVTPWVEMPLWAPVTEYPHLWDVHTTGAQATGLTCRPVRDTVRDVWTWLREVGEPEQRSDRPVPGMSPEREQAILAAVTADG